MLFVYGCVFTLVFIHLYRKMLEKRSESPSCVDALNRTFLEIKFCMWNVLHIIAYFVLCLKFKPTSLSEHFRIMSLGVVWFVIEKTFSTQQERGKCGKNVVYKNNTTPRYDDIFFNTLGQMLYIVYTLPL